MITAFLKNAFKTANQWLNGFNIENKLNPVKELTLTEAIIQLVRKTVNEERTIEMAMPGSELYFSVARPVGAILMADEKAGLILIGCFFRYKEYMLTARHIALRISAGMADIYLSTCEMRKDKHVLKNKPVVIPKELFELDRNVYDLEHDVFAVKLPKDTWSRISLQAVNASGKFSYGMTVSAVGFQDSFLKTSTGEVLPDSGAVEIWHCATTHKGFSGSPLFYGSGVVGMHVCGYKKYNIAIRMALIVSRLDFQEETSPSFTISSLEEEAKWQGKKLKYHDVGEGDFAVETGRGRMHYGLTYEDFMDQGINFLPTDYDEKQIDKLQDDYFKEKQEDFVKWLNRPKEKKGRWAEYEDEDAPIYKLEKSAPVHCNKTPKKDPLVADYLEKTAAALADLGHSPAEYDYPVIDAKLEKLSLRNHLKLYSERYKSIKKPPTHLEMERCINLIMRKCSSLKWEPTKGYKTMDRILEIIHSSAVGESKSPGHPYQEQGMIKNHMVINKLTPRGLAETTLRQWDEPFDIKVFLKAEPTKIKKIKKNMPRVVQGHPLHKMIKLQSMFSGLLSVAVDRWKESPIKYAFSPNSPGHIEHLARLFGNRNVYESDKSNWDYMYHWFLFHIFVEVVVRSCVQPADWTDSEFQEFLVDARKALWEGINGKRLRCTDGTTFCMLVAAIMSSGWLFTILANTVGQLAVDILVKIRMSFEDDFILNGNDEVFGGDDAQQTMDGIDTDEYIVKAGEMGLPLEPFQKRESFDHSEFYSTIFWKEDGIWKYKPVRFTKHIYSLMYTKLEDLPQALVSHMANYCFDTKRFRYFERMFAAFRKNDPVAFDNKLLKTQLEVQFSVKGCETT